MKYIYFGTPQFASLILEGLITAGMPPVALVCNPDRPIGRKKIITPPLTKQIVRRLCPSVDVLQPERIDDSFFETLRAYEADLFVVAAFSKILPDVLLTIPTCGTLGVHPSLLPGLRGASPIQSAILANIRTGVTLYKMDAKMDHGPIYAQEELLEDVSAHTYVTLEAALAKTSVPMVIRTAPKIVMGELEPKEQEHESATFTKKFKTEDGHVTYEDVLAAEQGDFEHAERIDRMIRALTPEPGVYTIKEGVRVKLLQACIREKKLVVSMIQKEGKNPTDVVGL